MKKLNRKDFIRYTTLASGSLFIPKFLQGFNENPLFTGQHDENILVVIQLSGGNDGLNTFIPYRDDQYYKLRPAIAIGNSSVLKVTGDMGFHPGMTEMQKLFDDGSLCIINQVGYPNPDHSHFRSMDIWQTASDSHKYVETGWLGRYMDANCDGCNNAHLAIEIDEALSIALKGKNIKGLAINGIDRLYRATQDPFHKNLVALQPGQTGSNDAVNYLYKTMIETSASIDYIHKQSKIYKSATSYPETKFGKNLKTAAELICSGSQTRVYYVSMTGFDTHSNQPGIHHKLLTNFSEGLSAFVSDLKKNNRFNQTLILAFSEFGRRAEQNASRGTDHGEANNVILAGGALKQRGFFNDAPDLTKLHAKNLVYQVDFRSIYSTIIRRWLHADDISILGAEFDKLPVI